MLNDPLWTADDYGEELILERSHKDDMWLFAMGDGRTYRSMEVTRDDMLKLKAVLKTEL